MVDVTIRKADGTWTVRAGGAILGESRNALVVSETGLADMVYFPRDDIAMAFLDPTDHTTTCPRKGVANYFTIVTKSGNLENAVWSYENPNPAAERIAGHLAFYNSDTVTVERV